MGAEMVARWARVEAKRTLSLTVLRQRAYPVSKTRYLRPCRYRARTLVRVRVRVHARVGLSLLARWPHTAQPPAHTAAIYLEQRSGREQQARHSSSTLLTRLK